MNQRRNHLNSKQPDRRQIQLEDEQLYGPPSPRPQSRNNNQLNHRTQSTESTSDSFSPITPAHTSHWSNSQEIANPSTDELFLSESYPPIHSQLHLPFFNEKLPSPIGMGRGHPIASSPYINSSSPPYGSIERLWKRITRILIEKPYQLPELADTLSYPASELSINSLSRLLEPYHLALPNVIRDHFQTHDGQDVFTLNSSRSSGSAPLGIVWGLWLMSCEEVEAEWGFWRRFDGGLMPGDAFTATDFSSSQYQQQQQHTSHFPSTRVDQGMSSCPAGWVREVYSHPAWLPLLSDRVGNYIGIDLSPPPSSPHSTPKVSSSSSPSSNSDCRRLGGGQGNARPEPGQVIAFGREIDEKVVLWRGEGRDGWANWLASFADDLEDGKFARLIGKKSKPSLKSRLSSRRNSDSERGCNHSEEDSEDTEDGLGDLSYFNDGAGFGGGASEDGDFYGWRLAPEYRGMSVIEALCARSKQRWAEVGSYSSRHDSIRSDSRSHSQSGALTQSPPILAGQKAGPSGSADQTEESGRQEDLNPPTPIAYVTPPSPRPPGAELEERDPQPSGSSSSSVLAGPPTWEAKKAESGLQPVPSERRHSQQLQQAPPRRRRVPPPAPVSLDLPTMDTLLLDAVVHPPGPGRKSSTSSAGSGSPNPNDSSGSTPKLISRLSLVTQRISEEMSRRTSPVHASPLPSHSAPNHSATATTHYHHHHPDDKEAIGMVILDHHSHLPTISPQPEKTYPDKNHSHLNNHNPPPAPPSASQGLGIIRTES